MPKATPPLFPFALIPAAGSSRRMGAPKLLLDLGGQTVIARLLAALDQGGVANRIVVVHPDDGALKAEVERNGGRVVVPPTPPAEMKESIDRGLAAVADELADAVVVPALDAIWLLVPGDHPVVCAETVKALLETARGNPGRIVVPTHGGRRGHPTLFPWRHALEIDAIPAGEGFNWILNRHAEEVVEVPVPSAGILLDLDTPEDYERLRNE